MPVRLAYTEENYIIAQSEAQKNIEEKDKKAKHFWAMVVWNYNTKAVEILELVHELGLENNVLKNGMTPAAKELGAIRSQLGSPRDFREVILQKASDLEKALKRDDIPNEAQKNRQVPLDDKG